MTEKFVLGKRVVIYYTDGDSISGTLVHMPQGSGDTVHVKSGDSLKAVNMNASTVEYMEQNG